MGVVLEDQMDQRRSGLANLLTRIIAGVGRLLPTPDGTCVELNSTWRYT